MSINIGDKVLFERYLGTVKFYDSDAMLYAVEFGESFKGGHTCNNMIPSGSGWWCPRGMLKLINTASTKTKQELIIDKINYLDKKFKERNKNEFPF